MSLKVTIKVFRPLKPLLITVVSILSATIISFIIQHFGFTEVNIVVIYILSVLLTSRYTKGYKYGVIASVIAMLAFNFFFTIPTYTFNVDNSTYIFTFVIMLLAAIMTSTLTSKLIHSSDHANRQEKQARFLYKIANSLGQANSKEDVAILVVKQLVTLLGWETTSIITGQSKSEFDQIIVNPIDQSTQIVPIKGSLVGEIISEYYSLPIRVRDKLIAYLCLPKNCKYSDDETTFLIESIAMQMTIAMERIVLASEKELAKAETEHERLKSNLLRAISHDLRTPLTAISGASEMLLHKTDDEDIRKIALGIHEDSRWLIRLVENILSLTRLQEGRLSVHVKDEIIEEIVGEAISRISKYSPDYKIVAKIPDGVIIAPMDGKLIEQVIINLIENAVKHSKPNEEIFVSVWQEKNKVWFEVKDHGRGINKNALPHIFDLFYVADRTTTDSKRGLGLGLAICKAVVQYHHGEIGVEINPDSGTTFRFWIPSTNETGANK